MTKNTQREDNGVIKSAIAAKFKAFLEEQEEGELDRKNVKKDKNVILVKKEY